MKKIYLLVLIFLNISQCAFSQASNLKWVNNIEGYFSVIKAITLDSHGCVYVVGEFIGTCDFDPGPGIFTMSSTGGYDAFIQKLDNNGDFIWAKRIGGNDQVELNSIAIDKKGNIICVGDFFGTCDFDPSIGTSYLTSIDHYDIYIEKLDSSGNFLWVKQMGGMSADMANTVVLDNDANIYTVGTFYYTVDFDPGVGIYNLTSNGYCDVYIQKLDSNGIFQWVKQIGNGDWNFCNSMAIDSKDNIYIVGDFGGMIDFDPGIGVYNVTQSSGKSVYILRLDKNGNFNWVKIIGWYGFAIATDIYDNIYINGTFGDVVDFDPGPNTYYMSPTNGGDYYIEKLDSAGNFKWAKQINGISSDLGYVHNSTINSDVYGNVYTTGDFLGTVDFDPGPNTYNLIGNADIFILKLDINGNFVWAKKIGGIGDDRGKSILTDSIGNVYATGYFNDTVDFDSGSNTQNLISNGAYPSSYILKLGACTSSLTSIITDTSCISFTLNDQTYTSSGSYTQPLSNKFGCDSIVIINLVIKTVDTTIIKNGIMLNALVAGATYQWVDCSAGYAIISGETNQSFLPLLNGSYALIITQNGCIDTSSCHVISTVSIDESTQLFKDIYFLPNPATDKLSVICSEEQNIRMILYNIVGERIFEKEITNNQTIDISFLPRGIYIIQASGYEWVMQRKLIIQ